MEETKTLNNDSQNVWVDMTDLAAWNGHFSGIQRVVFSYAERYHKQGARFFIYKRLSGRFVEVPGERFFARGEGKGTLSTKDKIKQAYRAIFPRSVRRRTTPVIRKILHYILAMAGLVQYISSHEPLFSEGDKVLVLGAGWESKNMVYDLAKHKQQRGFKLVHLWHDLLPITQPHLFDKKLAARQELYTKTALKISDLTVSVSRATEKDVIKVAADEKVNLGLHEVIREGEDSYGATKPSVPKRLRGHEHEPFIFSLGTLEIRKNHQLLYQAYKLAQQKGIDLPNLYIVGRPGWLAHDFLNVLKRDKSVAGKIKLLKGLPDSEVAWLFENCLFTIYPSLCEGWGLTVAESLGKGRLCLTCNVSSMPEVGGELADYFSPYNSQECLDKILHYATDKQALAKKESQLKEYKPHTWDQSFVELDKLVSAL